MSSVLRRRRSAVALGAAAGLALTLTAWQAPGASATARTGTHASPDSLPYQDPSLPVGQRVADLLGRMTLAEKIGQMTQAERGGIDADTTKITTDNLGSVLSGGGSVPTPNTPTAWADMVDRYQAAALDTRLAIPILYGVDTVHGDGNMYGATVFPHNIGLGATRDPALVRDVEHIAASETRSSGPQWAFAPCVCVARDDRWGRTYESFGETPGLVKKMETAIDGFQGKPGHLSDNDRVLATAKHFAGDGLTTYGTGSNRQTTGTYPIDQGVDQVNHATFRRLALAPYVPAVKKHHVGSVMPSYSDVDWTEDGLGNRINMHGNGDLINGWLKDQQHFKGLVISDYEGIHHIHPETYTYAQQVAAGVNAGIDMFMEPYDFETFESTLASEVAERRRPDVAHRRRGVADPDEEVPARTVRAPLHRPHPPLRDRRQCPPRRGTTCGGGVAGAAEERRGHAADRRVEAGVRRRQQRRQHRQPGGWLDADLAGRIDERDPGADDPRRHRGPARQRHLQPGRLGTRAVEGGRHRRGR